MDPYMMNLIVSRPNRDSDDEIDYGFP